jgi:hypothetical protein
MDNADGEEKKKHRKGLNIFLLLTTGVILAAVSTAAFWIADERHVRPEWLFAAGVAIIFFLVVGWGYRRQFRNPVFVSFFLAWTLGHVTLFLLVQAYLGFLWYLPVLVLELWIGYTIAIWKFGPPADKGIR